MSNTEKATAPTPEELIAQEERLVQDLTQARKERCEPVVEKILQELLDREILLADKTYIEQMVKHHLNAMFQHIVAAHLDEIFNLVDLSLEHSLKRANENLWGKKQEEVSIKDIDENLK